MEYYSKSYATDSLNVDARCNRASSYYEFDAFEKACNDWADLSKLGQINGKKTLYELLQIISDKKPTGGHTFAATTIIK